MLPSWNHLHFAIVVLAAALYLLRVREYGAALNPPPPSSSSSSSSSSSNVPLDAIYVTHYSPLAGRRAALSAALRDAGLLEITEFITDFDAEALGARSTWDVSDRLGFADAGGDAATDDAITEKEGSSSPSSAAALYDRFRFLRPTAATAAVRRRFGHATYLPTTLTPSELSLNLKHEAALQRAAALGHGRAGTDGGGGGGGGGGVALVLEDDAVLAEGFAQKLRLYLEQLPPPADWDVVCVGDMLGVCKAGTAGGRECRKLREAIVTQNRENNTNNGNMWARSEAPVTEVRPYRISRGNLFRGSDAYLVSSAGAAALLRAGMRPFAFPIDATMNFMLRTSSSVRRSSGGGGGDGGAGSGGGGDESLRVWWADPPLSTQGTVTGAVQSSIKKQKQVQRGGGAAEAAANAASAVAALQRALELLPPHEVQERYPPFSADALLELALSYNKLRNGTAAVAALERAVAVDPEHPFVLANLGHMLQIDGQAKAKVGQLDGQLGALARWRSAADFFERAAASKRIAGGMRQKLEADAQRLRAILEKQQK
jgi:GR25 family glycosyltransferase involved in LPS biosynthesis